MKDPRHGARSALIILFAINLLNFFDRNMFGAVAEPIRKEWALNDSQIGWLATAFIFLYAFVQVLTSQEAATVINAADAQRPAVIHNYRLLEKAGVLQDRVHRSVNSMRRE